MAGRHRRIQHALFVLTLIAQVTIGQAGMAESTFTRPPAWAQEAVWYQIFVERFRNGDPTNDPRPEFMQGADPGSVPSDWTVTSWNHDWYELQDWERRWGGDFYAHVAARRFGGDLQGVLDKLDYLHDLGVTALYFNPLNDAPSLHKYDARHYRHIDRTFGPDPGGDTQIMAAENPADPATWRWTAADRLFLRLIDEVHRRQMRLIVDYSWNHTGTTFWAWQDLRTHQAQSRFHDWFEVESFDDPRTAQDEFRYRGWMGVKSLPELKKVNVSGKRPGFAFEGDLQPEVKQHIFHVTQRWLDPNGDGNPQDGVDGFRLDVAEHVPLGFWRDYRTFVRRLNPQALLVGEAWWTRWPDQMMDPRPFLQGDVFDSVMHYQWYKPARRFFAQAEGGSTPTRFVTEMRQVYANYDQTTVGALMNLVASHDTPRLATSLQNKQQYKYRMGARGNPDLDIGPPSETTRREMRILLMHQFTFVSAPHIWNGDELGMWGGDDPDCRQPLWWDDIEHRPQVYRPDGRGAAPIPIGPDAALQQYYRELIALRTGHPELLRGALDYLLADDGTMTLAYRRRLGDDEVIVAFNRSAQPQPIELHGMADVPYEVVAESHSGCLGRWQESRRDLRFDLAPLSGVCLRTVR